MSMMMDRDFHLRVGHAPHIDNARGKDPARGLSVSNLHVSSPSSSSWVVPLVISIICHSREAGSPSF